MPQSGEVLNKVAMHVAHAALLQGGRVTPDIIEGMAAVAAAMTYELSNYKGIPHDPEAEIQALAVGFMRLVAFHSINLYFHLKGEPHGL